MIQSRLPRFGFLNYQPQPSTLEGPKCQARVISLFQGLSHQAQLGVLVTRGHVLGHVTHRAYSLAFPEVQWRQASLVFPPCVVVVSSRGRLRQ